MPAPLNEFWDRFGLNEENIVNKMTELGKEIPNGLMYDIYVWIAQKRINKKRKDLWKTLQDTIMCIYGVPESSRKNISREMETFKTEIRNKKRLFDLCTDGSGDAKLKAYKNIAYKPSSLPISAITESSATSQPSTSSEQSTTPSATKRPSLCAIQNEPSSEISSEQCNTSAILSPSAILNIPPIDEDLSTRALRCKIKELQTENYLFKEKNVQLSSQLKYHQDILKKFGGVHRIRNSLKRISDSRDSWRKKYFDLQKSSNVKKVQSKISKCNKYKSEARKKLKSNRSAITYQKEKVLKLASKRTHTGDNTAHQLKKVCQMHRNDQSEIASLQNELQMEKVKRRTHTNENKKRQRI